LWLGPASGLKSLWEIALVWECCRLSRLAIKRNNRSPDLAELRALLYPPFGNILMPQEPIPGFRWRPANEAGFAAFRRSPAIPDGGAARRSRDQSMQPIDSTALKNLKSSCRYAIFKIFFKTRPGTVFEQAFS